jgi:hypothetical protein
MPHGKGGGIFETAAAAIVGEPVCCDDGIGVVED